MILKGEGRLIKKKFLYYFFMGKCIILNIERIIYVKRKKDEINVVREEIIK
jgi:hypothetical protein